MRPSLAARSKRSRSEKLPNPASRAWIASWPSARNRSAIAGGRFMSRRKRICSASGRNYLLARQPRRIGQSLTDVLPLDIGVIAQDFVPGEAFSNQRYDQPDGYPHAADASAPPHLPRLEGDPVEGALTRACRLPSPYLGHFLDPVLVLSDSVGPPPRRRKRSPR